jgi:23S rRNA pseudouridine1911/1915/1917 synthase
MFDIIFEDDDLLVINKPAGLVCHPTKNGELSSLIGRARLYLNVSPPAAGDGENQGNVAQPLPPVTRHLSLSHSDTAPSSIPSPHLVNRLDRETSGVVIIAKNPRVAGELGKILEIRAVRKEYLAIVHGHVASEQGIIDAPLGRDEHSRVFVKDCVRPDGASSQTEFWVERKFSRPATSHQPPATFSLLRVVPRTGRKHQIRIHLAHLGHPIVGDKLYGGDEDLYLALVESRLTDAQRARLIFENHALHARAVQFAWRGKQIEFACEPEPWFKDYVGDDVRRL